ncbi:MAG: phenylalanine--tRNA ligase subunit alpha [Planctomycetota bacterium]|nr:MAG: phenylalanine--tRNA ligase subunit alpha [Planctomycetota bacterium]
MENDATLTEAQTKIRACDDLAALRAVEREYVGKDGVVARLLASIPTLPSEQRREVGQGANQLKQAVLEAARARESELAAAALAAERKGAGFDPTLPPARVERGSLHPVTTVMREVEDLFQSMGYTVLDGPEVELDYYNFEALNFPPDHPAREEYDTFWCEGKDLLLRTHTSPVQIRTLEQHAPPIRAIVPGRVFRHEEQDATHEHTFTQVEGLVVDEGVNVGHLTGTLKSFLRELFQRDLDVRLRPGYFPFVEPGFEFDIRCPFCEGGCRVCSKTTWVEFCGCGMVHPNVLRAGGVDPERYSGFAFGFGLDRLVMLRYGIDDIRHFMGGDLRFLEQF